MIGILPLRAIAFQSLFLLLAISIEALVLFRFLLDLDYKTSVRYATTLNLFSTVVGWLIFFSIQSFLPEYLRVQLISYFFFEHFFPNPWQAGITPILTVIALGVFMGVFFLEYQGLILIEKMLGKYKPVETKDVKKRSRGSYSPLDAGLIFKQDNQAYAVLVANACSFSTILFLLFFRWLEQFVFPVV
jgi:hypothetical protein